MKANELMIGDWVLTLDSTHKEKVFAQVDAIEEGQHSILVTRGCSNWFVDIDWIEPIPLTPEILEKNGFAQSPHFKEVYRLVNYDEYLRVAINMKNGRYLNIIKTFEDGSEEFNYNTPIPKFVHELQHALRLCGIDKEIVL